MKIVTVSADEHAALLNLEEMVRLALVQSSAGEFIAVALQVLDQVRRAETPVPLEGKTVSALAQSLIQRAADHE